ncbi:MAG: ATP-binding protein [Chthoniobacterales bacterium]
MPKNSTDSYHTDLATLQHLADTMPQIVWISRPDGYHEYYNKQWWDFTGMTWDEARGDGWNLLLHPEDRDRAIERWQHSLKTGEPYEIEYRFLRSRDGEYRWFLGRAMPQKDADGKIIRWFGTCTEIHEQKLVEEQLRAARDDMASANEQKDQFLALLSHELRTPLNSILGWTRLMQEGLLEPDELPEAIDSITNNAKAQAQLIEDILDISRIINDKLRLEKRVLQLADVVKAAADAIRPVATQAKLRVAHTVEATDLLVEADPGRLQQIVANLLANAVKFTPPGGRIDLRLTRAQSFASIEVSDTGRGIEPAFLPYIFDRFKQADSSNTRQEGGLGLGLAIVRHLVEMHGGIIRAASDGPGKGSTFTVLLPVVAVDLRSANKSQEANQVLPAAEALKNLQILIVDDDESAREMIALTLRKFGAQVECASNVADALESLEKGFPQLLISDIAMPGADGYELIRALRKMEADHARRIPAIALTAFASVQDRSRAMELGFHLHLSKPIEPLQLIRAVAALVPKGV